MEHDSKKFLVELVGFPPLTVNWREYESFSDVVEKNCTANEAEFFHFLSTDPKAQYPPRLPAHTMSQCKKLICEVES